MLLLSFKIVIIVSNFVSFFLSISFFPPSPFLHPEGSSRKAAVHSDCGDFDNEPHKRRNQILSVLFAVAAMLGYAVLSGLVTIQSSPPQLAEHRHADEDEDEDEGEGDEE